MQIFLLEDLVPEDWKPNNAKSKAVPGHLPSSVTDNGGMYRNTRNNDLEQPC